MSVPSAYLGVVIIWSTTPLAIKWSGEDVGFLFGLTSRMVIGLVCILLMLAVLRRRVIWNKSSWPTFLVAGTQVYLAMMLTYWAAQSLPSGWISVIFGLTPIVTAFLARLWLANHRLTMGELSGACLGFVGLLLIFADSLQLSSTAVWAVGAMLMAVFTHSAGAVLVKRLQAGVDGMAITAGGLIVSTPLFLLSWWMGDGELPATLSSQNSGSIVYLGILGSAIGFSMYFYLLKHISVRAVALITLLTPVIALWLGQSLNGETITSHTFLGTAVILSGLAISQFWQKPSSN